MAKANLKLASGAVITIEGTVAEVHQLLTLYSSEGIHRQRDFELKNRTRSQKGDKKDDLIKEDEINLTEIVSLVKNCDEAASLEKNILDRASQVDRTLLPLYIIHEYKGNKYGLTSGEISKIIADLGVKVAPTNISKTLAGTALRYVIGDKVRKIGQPVRYKLSRRGLQYLKGIISGKSNEK